MADAYLTGCRSCNRLYWAVSRGKQQEMMDDPCPDCGMPDSLVPLGVSNR